MYNCLGFGFCGLMSSLVLAEEKTIKAFVKDIDIKNKSILISNLSLDVNRKTKITLDGKEAGFNKITKGIEIKLTYDDNTEVALSITVGKEPAKDFESTAKVLKSLQGEWKCIVDRDIDKKVVKDQDRRIAINGNTLTMKRTYGDKRGTYQGKFEIDATSGNFDFVGKGPNGQLVEWVGIYKLEENRLSLCFKESRGDKKSSRPQSFDHKDDFLNKGIVQIFIKEID